MAVNSFKTEIVEELEKLDPASQKTVLEFVRQLSSHKQKGVSGEAMLAFAGVFDKAELAVMTKAIDEQCEQINPDEW